MSIKIVISDTVGFKVEGAINNEAGNPEPFDFSLTCARLDADQIQAKLKDQPEASLVDFMVDVIKDWRGVKAENSTVLPYSADAYRQLCKIPGIAAMAYRTYLGEVGAKEKN